MLLTPKYFERQGYKPAYMTENIVVYEFGLLTVDFHTNAPMQITFDITVLVTDILSNYKVSEFKKLCEGLRIPLNSLIEPSKTPSEYGC